MRALSTFSKKVEAPVKKILTGTPPEEAVSKDSLSNPDSLGFFVKHAGRHEG